MLLRRILGASGIFVALCSLFFVAAALGELLGLSKGETGPGVLLALLIFFLGTCACGVMVGRWGFRNPPSPDAAPNDRAAQIRLILNLAKRSGGQVSHLQVAAETTLSLEQSHKLLDDLVNDGLAQLEVDDNAVMLYVFPDFRSAGTRELPPA